MRSNFTAMQRKALEILLNKYENSKTYKGENQVQQSFAVAPTALMPEYDSDFANVDKLRLFESELEELGSLTSDYTTRLQSPKQYQTDTKRRKISRTGQKAQK